MNRIYFSLFSILCSAMMCQAQTSSLERLKSYQELQKEKSPIQGISFRNIGPTIMSGRITDIEVNPKNTNEFYVAYASGGVFHSTNNGQSFEPIFDNEATLTIGDMAVNWAKNIIWIGTGEVNSSRSSYAGTGIYVSKDNGKTWQHKGLEESHHIGKIILNPTNENTAWVAVLGHLYTKNSERGIFKTTDGGETWNQTLFVNDSTGCVDLMIDPNNEKVLYTTSWMRTRTAWNFVGNGEASAIYKSEDAGNTWKVITTPTSGFPSGKGVGRIGIALCEKKSNVLYAIVDNNFNQEKKKDDEKDKLKPRDILAMNTSTFLALDNKKLDTYLKENGYPEQYTAESVKADIQSKKYTVKDIADWKLADADANLFDTPIFGAEVYKSNDAGKTWTKTNEQLMEGVFFTYGYYFGTISVSPINENKIIVAGYPIVLSEDGGKTFKQIDGANCHPDYHRVWINPENDKHIIACNDGGLNITYDDGKTWFKANNPAVGQFYAIAVDDAKPYNVYGGLQDNGTWFGPSTHEENNAWHQDGTYAYKGIGGGDGMQVQVDKRNNETVYAGYQFGNYMRINKNTGASEDIKIVHQIGEKPYRFNWQTPICLSKHNQDIFYMGSNCFHRSMQQGKSMETLSKDLTSTTNKGNVPFGTITTISESPLRFGTIYAGTDDGNIHSTKDVGYNWTKISNPLPQQKWVSRIVASQHKLERVYATLNGYRNDDFNAYVFVSNDYGKTWKDVSGNLPNEPVNVIREDPKNENTIYVGTDNGLYVSFDNGNHFMAWKSNLPRVAIHDIAIQERENEIVLGTHGRSIYIASLNLIQQLKEVENKSIFINKIDSIAYNESLGSKWAVYAEPTKNIVPISFYTNKENAVTLAIRNEKGKILFDTTLNATLGFNSFNYDLSMHEKALKYFSSTIKKADDGNYYLPVGKYTVEVMNNSKQLATTVLAIIKK